MYCVNAKSVILISVGLLVLGTLVTLDGFVLRGSLLYHSLHFRSMNPGFLWLAYGLAKLEQRLSEGNKTACDYVHGFPFFILQYCNCERDIG